MSDWVRGVLVGFNLGGIFAGTIVFLAVRSAHRWLPQPPPGMAEELVPTEEREMTDPVAFLQSAHARAQQAAQEATRGPWHFDGNPSGAVTAEPYARPVASAYNRDPEANAANAAHIALNDPAAVLRRIAAERKILAEHANDYGDCTRCAGDDGEVVVNGMSHPLRTCVPHPCATIRALAEAWGWQEGQG